MLPEVCSDDLGYSDVQARLGGEPSRMAQIQAFLRLRMADAGPLDFDTPGGGGTDTTWPTIFYCLRCGYHDEALQVCHCCRHYLTQ